jgi:hypothetical protein
VVSLARWSIPIVPSTPTRMIAIEMTTSMRVKPASPLLWRVRRIRGSSAVTGRT